MSDDLMAWGIQLRSASAAWSLEFILTCTPLVPVPYHYEPVISNQSIPKRERYGPDDLNESPITVIPRNSNHVSKVRKVFRSCQVLLQLPLNKKKAGLAMIPLASD